MILSLILSFFVGNVIAFILFLFFMNKCKRGGL